MPHNCGTASSLPKRIGEACLREGFCAEGACELPISGPRTCALYRHFAFDNIKESRLTSTSPDAQALADKVSAAWIAFARSGDPNTSRLPKWAAFNAKDRFTMVFNNESRVENDPLRPACRREKASLYRHRSIAAATLDFATWPCSLDRLS
jgi:Carboxylesterase family